METMLKTGEVAEMLGVSRQHVVDMCDRGELSCVRVGRHRRVSSTEVDRVRGRRSLDRDAIRSLWLHRVVLGHLMLDPEHVMRRAVENTQRRLAKAGYSGSPKPYYEQWLDILNEGVEATAAALVDPSEKGQVLRSCSPFTGVLTQEERGQVLRSFESVS